MSKKFECLKKMGFALFHNPIFAYLKLQLLQNRIKKESCATTY